jgi:hypothetical protein
MSAREFKIGMLVTVRGPYVGSGRYGVDAWTGRTMRVFGISGDDLELGAPDEVEHDVAIYFGRCSAVAEVRTVEIYNIVERGNAVGTGYLVRTVAGGWTGFKKFGRNKTAAHAFAGTAS